MSAIYIQGQLFPDFAICDCIIIQLIRNNFTKWWSVVENTIAVLILHLEIHVQFILETPFLYNCPSRNSLYIYALLKIPQIPPA